MMSLKDMGHSFPWGVEGTAQWVQALSARVPEWPSAEDAGLLIPAQ